MGHIINSINNIFKIVTKLANSKKRSLNKDVYGPNEILTYEYENKSPQVTAKPTGKTNVEYICKRLEVGIEYLTDLVAVHD